MDPRYALFIWSSFGVAALAVVWNLLAPKLARNQIRRRLSDALDDHSPDEETQA